MFVFGPNWQLQRTIFAHLHFGVFKRRRQRQNEILFLSYTIKSANSLSLPLSLNIYIYLYVYVCVCVSILMVFCFSDHTEGKNENIIIKHTTTQYDVTEYFVSFGRISHDTKIYFFVNDFIFFYYSCLLLRKKIS